MASIFKEKNVICRICFQPDPGDMFSIFVETNGVSSYESLVQHTKLNITADDGGSHWLCGHCYEELSVLVKFLHKCIRANELFEKIKQKNADECNTGTDSNKMITNYKDSIQSGNEHKEALQTCEHTKNKKMYTCQCCDKAFTRRGNLKLHLSKHNGEHKWNCHKCGAGVHTRALALRHCAPRERRACPTPGCTRSYLSAHNLKIHIRKHNGEKPFECADCLKKFRCKNTLRDHMKIHSGIKRYMCPTCGKQFSTNKLSTHMRTHSPNTFPCATCSRVFPSTRALAQHAGTHAPPTRAHKCHVCSAKYNHRQSLNKHVKKRHGLIVERRSKEHHLVWEKNEKVSSGEQQIITQNPTKM